MRSLLTRYSRYFNRRHDRVGHLLQDVYKGILVDNENYFWWLSRYIHRNPIELLDEKESLVSYPYSSYSAYLKSKKINWIETKYLLDEINNYKNFVENSEISEPEDLKSFTLE